MNLKPFNLEAALAGAKVVTRDGRKVSRFVYYNDALNGAYTVVCIIDGCLRLYTDNGKCYDEDVKSYLDLFMAPTTREGWINIYSRNPDENCVGLTSNVYRTKEIADSNANLHERTARIRIEWEE